MDNLDISDSLSSSFPWLPYGASQFDYQNGDLSYFSQRSAMLEPIIEETSDDDDVSCGHVWTHNDNQWSSESDAGSVIRVELIQGKITLLKQTQKHTNDSTFISLAYFAFYDLHLEIIGLYLLKFSISVNRK